MLYLDAIFLSKLKNIESVLHWNIYHYINIKYLLALQGSNELLKSGYTDELLSLTFSLLKLLYSSFKLIFDEDTFLSEIKFEWVSCKQFRITK